MSDGRTTKNVTAWNAVNCWGCRVRDSECWDHDCTRGHAVRSRSCTTFLRLSSVVKSAIFVPHLYFATSKYTYDRHNDIRPSTVVVDNSTNSRFWFRLAANDGLRGGSGHGNACGGSCIPSRERATLRPHFNLLWPRLSGSSHLCVSAAGDRRPAPPRVGQHLTSGGGAALILFGTGVPRRSGVRARGRKEKEDRGERRWRPFLSSHRETTTGGRCFLQWLEQLSPSPITQTRDNLCLRWTERSSWWVMSSNRRCSVRCQPTSWRSGQNLDVRRRRSDNQ